MTLSKLEEDLLDGPVLRRSQPEDDVAIWTGWRAPVKDTYERYYDLITDAMYAQDGRSALGPASPAPSARCRQALSRPGRPGKRVPLRGRCLAQHLRGPARARSPLMASTAAMDKLLISAVDRQGGRLSSLRRTARLADVHLTVIRPIGKGGRVDAGNLVATHFFCNIEPDLAHTIRVPECGCWFCGDTR